jgi:predicted nucleic acid-binding protein
VSPILIDTNVLVYTFDQNDPRRQERAIEILRALEAGADGRLSVQCLAEFCAVAMRRLRPAMGPEETLAQVERFHRIFPVHDLTPMIILEAMRGVCVHQLSYYDAQLWASARLHQIPVIFSEDFKHGSLEGVHFVNPFLPDFDIARWR